MNNDRAKVKSMVAVKSVSEPYMARVSSHDDSSDDSTIDSKISNEASSKNGRLQKLRVRTTRKARKVIELGAAKFGSDKKSKDADSALNNIQDDPAFNPTHVDKQLKVAQAREGSLAEKAKVAVEVSGWALAHPKQAAIAKAKKLAAGKLSSIQKPHALPNTGLELLDAHDALSVSESPESSRNASPNREHIIRDWNRRRAKVERLEKQGDSMRVAWTTRHTNRVRVVPKEHIKIPDRDAFLQRDSEGNTVRYQWEKWLGYVSGQARCRTKKHPLILLLRTCCTILKTSVLSMSTISSSYHLISIRYETI